MRRHWYITIIYICRVENCKSILHPKRKRVYGRWPPKEKIVRKITECLLHMTSPSRVFSTELERISPQIREIFDKESPLFRRLK